MSKEKFFRDDAKQIVDMMFDNKVFNDDYTRDELTALEDFICIAMQLKFDCHWRAKELFDRIEKRKIAESQKNISTNE